MTSGEVGRAGCGGAEVAAGADVDDQTFSAGADGRGMYGVRGGMEEGQSAQNGGRGEWSLFGERCGKLLTNG